MTYADVHADQTTIVWFFYLTEAVAPGFILFQLQPSVARKFCRDCATNPMQARCVPRLCYRAGCARAPRRQRGGHGAGAEGRDDGGGSDDGGGGDGPPPRRSRPSAGGVS
jgi:hypothetical protein